MKKVQKKPLTGISYSKLVKKTPTKKTTAHRHKKFHLPTIKRTNQKLIGLTGYKNRTYNLRIGQSKSEVLWLNSIEPMFGCKIEREKAVLGLPTIGNRREIFVVDGYLAKGNVAFEFLGNYWHSNPKMYDPKAYSQMLRCTHGQNYLKTVRRFQVLSSLGYKVWYVWESDWKKGSKGKFWKPGEPV